MSGTKAFPLYSAHRGNSVRLPKTVGRFVKELQGFGDMPFIIARKRDCNIIFKTNNIRSFVLENVSESDI